MAERDPRAPRIRPVRTVNHRRPDYGGNVDVEGYDDSELVERVEDLEGRTAGHIIRDEGDDLPQRPWLDFVGAGVTATDFGGVTRVSIPGPGGPGGHIGSHIDLFDGIVDDTVADFELTYTPADRSWNVDLNGITLTFGVDYTVDGQVVTVTDPETLFAGASESDEWSLQVQYDRLSTTPTPQPQPPAVPEAEFVNSKATGEQATSTPSITMDAAPAAGSSVLLGFRSKFGGGVTSITGMGATWTQLKTMGFYELWVGVGCNGSGATANLVSDHANGIHVIEVTTGLTATGADFQSVGSATDIAAVTAAEAGVMVTVTRQGAGITLTPSSGWTSPTAANDATMSVQNAGVGDVVDATAGIAWQAAMVGVVKFA